jgi:hypothetical protein
MTAVEYLYQVMYDKQGRISLEEFQQAKEMEKQQIIDSYNIGFIYPIKFDFKNNKSQEAEQYYNETFNKNESN